MTNAKPLWIGFFTPGAYADEARLLRESFQDFGCEHHLELIPPQPNWDAATHFKAQFVRRCMDKFPNRKLIYLDVDSLILSPVDELYSIDCDIAAVRFQSELLGGLIVVNPSARKTIDRWCELCATVDRTWEQKKLARACEETNAKLVILGQDMMWIPGLTPRVYGTAIQPKIITTRGSLRLNPRHE